MSDAYVGEIRLFAGNYAPVNWHVCDGTLLNISGNETLYSVLGTTYGGNGTSNFALPDMRGRVPVHAGNLAGGGTYALGSKGGSETHTTSVNELPGHTHAIMGSNVTGNGDLPGEATLANTNAYIVNPVGNTLVAMADAAIGTAGNSQPHGNIMPYLALIYIICTNGLFPPRS